MIIPNPSLNNEKKFSYYFNSNCCVHSTFQKGTVTFWLKPFVFEIPYCLDWEQY